MKRLVLMMVVMVACGNVAADACNGEFPKKGSLQSFTKAARLSDEAISLNSSKQPDRAIAKLIEAIRIYPYDAALYTNLALVFENDKRDFAAARKWFNSGIQQEPRCASIRLGLIGLLLEEKKFSEARRTLNLVKGFDLTQEDRQEIAKVSKVLDDNNSHGK